MEQEYYQMLDAKQLIANHATVSQNKCGLFLCRKGDADLLLNNRSFHIDTGTLCLYTPYTFIRIVRHSDDIEGYLLECELDILQPALANIPATERFAIRSHPCVKLDDNQCQRIEQTIRILNSRTQLLRQTDNPQSTRLLRLLAKSLQQAFCYEVLEAYFNGVPCVLSPIEQHINISNVSKVWIPKSFTAADFAESIRLALECKDSHEAIYQMRKPEIEKYSISSTAQKYLDFYNKILHE